MGKTVAAIVGIVAVIAIAIVAPPLGAALAGAIGISTAVATALVTTVLSMAVSMAFRALGVGVPSAKNQVGPPQVFRQAVSNSFIVYGKRRVGGLLVFYHARTSSGDHYRYFVVACAGHRCQGVVSWMLNDEVVTVSGNAVTSGKYSGKAWLWFQRGLATETANATFVSECGGKWTSNHKGNGTAAIYAKFQMTEDVVQAGMPNITAIIEGRDEIYNPADATYTYTRNASRIFYDFMRTPREIGGFGAYTDELPNDTWQSAQANVCNETVNSNIRYAIDAVITTGAAPSEIRDVLIVNQAGTYTYSGGKHLMRPGYWVPSSATLAENDLAGPIQVSAFLAADAAANEVQGTYISTTDKYQGAPFTTQKLTIPPTDVRQIDLDLAFTTNKDQADRIAKIMLNRAQCEKTVVWPMNISGLKITAMDTVQLDSTRYGLSNYAWTVANWGLSADWGVVLQLREENEAVYGPPALVAPPTPPTIVQPTGPLLLPSQITQLILSSYVTDADPLDGLLQATPTQITLENHTRTYTDKAVSVTGGTITTLDDGTTAIIASTVYHIYYDDSLRVGGAVARKATRLSATAATSVTNPYRHYVGTITTPASGTSSGTGSAPSGWNDTNWRYNTA